MFCLLKYIYRLIKCVIFIPHFVVYLSKYSFLKQELIIWKDTIPICKKKNLISTFFLFIGEFKEYRTVFYHRIGFFSKFLSWYAPGMPNCYIITKRENIGVGLVLEHGFSTIINCESIGANVKIWQNVTLGKERPGGKRPILGDNVSVYTGAIVIGGIKVGNNSSIGAGSVVLKDVPENTLVVGVRARIVEKKS